MFLLRRYFFVFCAIFILQGATILQSQDPFVALDPFGAEEQNSNGIGWADYDNDGDQDIYVCNGGDMFGQKNALYRNNGDETFTKITSSPFGDDAFISGSCSWGDFDNDGDLDLYVSSLQNFIGAGKENCLYENQGGGTFVKNTSAGPPVSDAINSAGVGWGDYNNDSWLDLFVSNGYKGSTENTLYRSDGDGTFTSVTGIDLVSSANATGIAGFAWADYDNDGDLDLFTASSGGTDAAKNFLWRNDGNNVFTKIAIFDAGNSQACSWGDYDNDGDLDLYITNYGEPEEEQEENFLYRNDGSDTFTKMTPAQVGDIVNDALVSKGSAWGDIDNDGDLDMFVATPGPADEGYKNCLYINDGSGYFTRNTTSVVRDADWGFGTAMADFNNDGFLDIFLCRSYDNVLYKNVEPQNGNSNRWLVVELEGTSSNKSAIGAKVRARATVNSQEIWQMREVSSQTGYGSQNSLRVHFGFGSSTGLAKAAASTISELRVEFPSGKVVTKTNVATNQILSISESEAPIAVKLASFEATLAADGFVHLHWRTASEMNTAGFYVQKSQSESGPYKRIHPLMIAGQGSPSTGHDYYYKDRVADKDGTLYYRLEEVTLDGESITMPPIEVSIASAIEAATAPQDYWLAQNYPNPFNPYTTIRYNVAMDAYMQLAVYDVSGALVKELLDGYQRTGAHSIVWDGTNQKGEAVSSGVYIYRLSTTEFSLSKKMVLTR